MAGDIYLADTTVYVLQGRYPQVGCHRRTEWGDRPALLYDTDYDRIAEITGQPMEWVAERGSL